MNSDHANSSDFSISTVVEAIPEALSVQINQMVTDLKARGEDITTLSLGEAYFNIPEFDYNDIDLEKGSHYSDSMGLPALRQKLSDYYGKQYDAEVNWENEILITAGSKLAIFMCMMAVLNTGEEVLIHEPAWLSYQEQARLAGGEATFIPFNATPGAFESYITPKTKMLIINNPNNPQGRIYSEQDIEHINSLCLAHGLYLLVDEAYSDFVIDRAFNSAAKVIKDKSHFIVVNSLSKNLGLSGWRIGYVISNDSFISQLLKLNQHLITCAPTLLMLYLTKHFDYILENTLAQALDVTIKRNHLQEYADEIGLSYLPGSSTFYMFLDVSGCIGETYDFALDLLIEHKIAVVPGIAYGDSTKDFVRISVGTESVERIKAAFRKIKALIDSSREASQDVSEDYIAQSERENSNLNMSAV